jgi:hypothetical protein
VGILEVESIADERERLGTLDAGCIAVTDLIGAVVLSDAGVVLRLGHQRFPSLVFRDFAYPAASRLASEVATPPGFPLVVEVRSGGSRLRALLMVSDTC